MAKPEISRNDDIETLNPRQDKAPPPGLNLTDLAPLINSQYSGSDRSKPAPAADTRPAPVRDGSPQPAVKAEGKDLTLTYGDAEFDKKLASGKIENLKINGLPKGVQASPWLDKNGFYIWFINGTDNRTPHYLPPTLKTLEIDGVVKDVDKMRIDTSHAYAMRHDTSKNTTRALDGTETVFQFGSRMSALADDKLQAEVNSLAQVTKNSTNPGLHLMYANFLTAAVIRPIVNNYNPAGNTFKMTKEIEDAVKLAADQAARTADLARQQRNFYVQLQAERLTYMLDFTQTLLPLFPKDGIEVLPPIGNK